MTKRDRMMLGVVGVLALCAAFFFLAVKPKQAELAALEDRRAAAQERVDRALASLHRAEAARAAFRRDSATLALLGKAVPADDDTPSLLYQVHKAARQAGIGFDAVVIGQGAAGASAPATPATPGAGTPTTPGATPGPDGLSALPLKVTFRGDFFDIDRFLGIVHGFARRRAGRLDIEGRLLTVDAVSITRKGGSLQAEVVTSAYLAPQGPAAAGAAGAAGAGPAAAAPATTTPDAAPPAPTAPTGATS
jgi:hypothetical protein